jgi:predicted PurR-regulated permease PerM
MIFSLFIIPVFAVQFPYSRDQFVDFIRPVLPKKYHGKLPSLLKMVSYRYSKYILGLIKIYLIAGALKSIGLPVFGIKHAILFGMLTAFMTMIPYIGTTINSLLPITVTWVTKDSLPYLIVKVAAFGFEQNLENSIISPKIIGRQLNVSAWTILVALSAAGIIWGVSGIVLFMPIIAILKIICDQADDWLPLNILMSRKGSIHEPRDPKQKEE